jgi:hypothetical protein
MFYGEHKVKQFSFVPKTLASYRCAAQSQLSTYCLLLQKHTYDEDAVASEGCCLQRCYAAYSGSYWPALLSKRCHYLQGRSCSFTQKMMAVHFSEMLVTSYQTKRRHIMHYCRCENLESCSDVLQFWNAVAGTSIPYGFVALFVFFPPASKYCSWNWDLPLSRVSDPSRAVLFNTFVSSPSQICCRGVWH